ncbi:hypothetical protein DXB41_01265 [Segatella copri]|uniref:Uncharacterized protein n=1 Tax=Segatella copri TaxID=165179 RepID=A0A3E5EC94_9BACT|nr:hypothetical protein DXB41_01265 [Segatella copri]RGS17224.1 hypothetical protein DWY11_05225 [Segatella copri]
MNIQKMKYKFHSGKNSKPWYYIKEYARLYTPACILNRGGSIYLTKPSNSLTGSLSNNEGVS